MNTRALWIAVCVASLAAGGGVLVGSGAETRSAAETAAQSGTTNDVHGGDASYEPTRISKAIELLERDQPIYDTQVDSGGYEEGKAHAWPLNPEGELLIGLKIEDRHALENAEASTAVPGVGFAEWGPGDMSLSFNVSRADAPQLLSAARARVFAATKRAGIPFLNRVRADDIEQMIDEGVRIGSNPGAEVADRGRRYTNRRMPW